MQKMSVESAMDIFRAKCKSRGLKLTPQRTTIYKELLNASNHPSIDDILKKVRLTLPNISFDTVYRTVLSFSEIGIINIVEGYGGAKRFDPNVLQHHHFKCIKCNKIIDFYSKYYDNIKIPENLQKQVTVLNKKVLLEGVCEQCSKKK